MTPLRSSWMRLRSFFSKEQLDRELHAELASHLELHIADNLRSGMNPEEARRDALLKLGGIEQTKDPSATPAASHSSNPSFKISASPFASSANPQPSPPSPSSPSPSASARTAAFFP